MPFAISVTSNLDALRQQLAARRDQIPYAVALALTRTAQLVQQAERHEMRDVFDRPTPFTLNGVAIMPATKRNLSAFVFLKDDPQDAGAPADKYLTPQIKGGARVEKRFEKALESVGALPPGYRVVPGAAAKIDAYGNMSQGQIVEILAYFRSFGLAGYSMNTTIARKAKLAAAPGGYAYFVGRPGNGRLPLGIWRRTKSGKGSELQPVMIFVDGAIYRAIYDFNYVAKVTVEAEFPRQLQQAAQEALRTAR